MKHPRFLYTCLALLGVGALIAATVPQLSKPHTPIDDLRDRANRMEHHEFLEYAMLEQDSLLRATTSRQWIESMGVHAGQWNDELLPDSIVYRCLPTLYDLVVYECYRYGISPGYSIDDLDVSNPLIANWKAFHANDPDPLPRYYIDLNFNTSETIQMYNTAPDSWERGIFLLNSVDTLYQLQKDYIAKYKNSPFEQPIRYCIATTEIERIDFTTTELIRSTDSVRLTLDIRNAHRANIEIYELPDGQKEKPKNLRLYRQHPISIEGVVPFNRNDYAVVLPPLPIGNYYIYLALPDDPDNKPLNKYEALYNVANVKVSDIRAFSYTTAENEKGDIHVVDAISGEPITDFRLSFEKNSHRYTVTYGKDSHSLWYPYSPSRESNIHLNLYPSSPIYRAGDTAQISIVCMEVAPSGRRALASEKIRCNINDPNWKAFLDTVLVTDEDGVATLSLPFTDDMHRGGYWVQAKGTDTKANYRSSNCIIEFADYRMPTATMHLEHTIIDSVVSISGSVLRTTGMPVPNLAIEGHVLGLLDTTLTLTTDSEGRFAYTFSLSQSKMIRDQWTTLIFSTALQGEYIEERDHILPHRIAQRTTPVVPKKDTIPTGKAFILPRQDFRVNTDGTVTLHLLAAADMPLHIFASSRDEVTETRWTHISKGDNVLTFHVPTDNDNYLNVELLTYYNGYCTSETKTLQSPNRHELHIVPEVMRDYLVPGAKEEWQLQLTNQHGKPQKGRMILALNNIAISALTRLRWTNPLPNAWSVQYANSNHQKIHNVWGMSQGSSSFGKYWSFPKLPLFELSGIVGAGQKMVFYAAGVAPSNREVATYGAEDLVFEEELEVLRTCQDPNSPDFSSVGVRTLDTSVGLYRHDLISGRDGRISLSFRTPMDNTSWLLQAVAWTRDGATGDWTDTLVAKREVMVHLSQPRFLRLGDEATLQAVVTNAADRTQSVNLLLEVFDPATDRNLYKVEKRVKLARNEERNIPLSVKIDPAWCHATDLDTPAPLAVRIRAIGQNGASDGEQRALPILNICAPVREAQPFCTRDSIITLTLPARPKGATNEQVELTYCTSPIPTVLSGLDITEDTTLVSATAVMHNLYALAIRNRLIETYPEAFNAQMTKSMVNGKWSNGQYNLASICRRLRHFQRASGAFAWLDDSRARDCYYTTLRIVSLMEELDDADALPAELRTSFTRAKAWLALQKEYRTYQHNLDSLSQVLPTSCLSEWPYWALRKERQGKHEQAKTIINALRRYSTTDAEKGMYWANIPDYWWWMRTSDIEATFLLAFSRIDPEEEELAQMRQWLILNHHTNRWGKSSLAAYCAYALMQGLSREEVAAMDTTTYHIPLPAGTTTYTLHLKSLAPNEVYGERVPDLSGGKGAALGALSVEYQAPLSDIREHGTKALRIHRDYLLRGKTINSRTKLHAGDRITVRLTIESDREYDNLTLTDRRAALLEPTETLSGYGWQDALYYREVRDQLITFYLTHLRKGKTVLTYDCILSTDGTSRSGLSDIVSDLAPEYTAHTATEEIIVK